MGCDANDLLQYFSLGQEATETSPFLHTLNSFADIISLVPENISPCKYYDLNFQNNMLNSSQNLFLLHLNIRSLQKNYDKVCELIDQLPTRPHLIGLSETKIKHQPLLDISLPNYNFIHAASPGASQTSRDRGRGQNLNQGGKGLHQNPKAFSGQNHKFSAQKQVISEKKKRSSPKSEGIFWPKSQIFRPKTGDLPQKKGLCRNLKAFSGRNHKF